MGSTRLYPSALVMTNDWYHVRLIPAVKTVEARWATRKWLVVSLKDSASPFSEPVCTTKMEHGLLPSYIPYDTGDDSHTNEFGQAARLQLRHDVGPIDFDRPRADPEVEADDFVGLAGDQSIQHLAFAFG